MKKKVVIGLGALAAAAFGLALFLRWFPLDRAVAYADDADNFKYGSIGSDAFCDGCNGLPLEVVLVLPEMFAQYLPPHAPHDYTAFGFVQEPGHQLPIGFSQRSQFSVPLTGLNCASCHTGTIRDPAGGPPRVILGIGSPNADLQAYFQFLFHVATDSRFTPEQVIPAMERRRALGPVERLLYRRIIIPKMKQQLLAKQAQLQPIFGAEHPASGPGRIDTFNPYKLMWMGAEYPHGLHEQELFGTARFRPIWGQAVKQRMALNWDGNAPSIRDRNLGAAFGAGASLKSADTAALERVQRWLVRLSPPPYPFSRTEDPAVLRHGAQLYRHYCSECHDAAGSRIDSIEPLASIGTDSNRLNSYTGQINAAFRRLGLSHMTKTAGYANGVLDGVWARAPYLHNGSVPTLWDLLTPAERRNGGFEFFYTGHATYDTARVGFRTDVADVGGRPSFRLDLRQRGNGNQGHSGAAFGTNLSDPDKRALIEYLKTL